MNITCINFLQHLKNAARTQKPFFDVSFHKKVLPFLFFLYKEGMVQSFKFLSNKTIRVYVRYFAKKTFLTNITTISTPSHNVYLKYEHICKILKKQRMLVFSTSYGLLSGDECKKRKVGGKFCFYF